MNKKFLHFLTIFCLAAIFSFFAPPINDVGFAAGKTLTLTERMKLSFFAQAFNVFNHSQWIGGFINDVAPIGYTGSQRSMLEPSSSLFKTPSAVFSSNPRTLQLALKFSF